MLVSVLLFCLFWVCGFVLLLCFICFVRVSFFVRCAVVVLFLPFVVCFVSCLFWCRVVLRIDVLPCCVGVRVVAFLVDVCVHASSFLRWAPFLFYCTVLFLRVFVLLLFGV